MRLLFVAVMLIGTGVSSAQPCTGLGKALGMSDFSTPTTTASFMGGLDQCTVAVSFPPGVNVICAANMTTLFAQFKSGDSQDSMNICTFTCGPPATRETCTIRANSNGLPVELIWFDVEKDINDSE